MDCPICKNAMITLELQEVEIDYCTDCGGIWLDAGELELLLGEPEKAAQLIKSFKIDSRATETRPRDRGPSADSGCAGFSPRALGRRSGAHTR